MNKFIYILFLSLFLINCTSNTIIKKPDNLISQDQMVDLLTDMLLASGAHNIKNLNLKRNVNYFSLIFEKHHIDSTQFKESNFYYITKIDEYEKIFKRVDKRLKTQRKKFENEIRVQDSIKKIKKYSSKRLFKNEIRIQDFLKKSKQDSLNNITNFE